MHNLQQLAAYAPNLCNAMITLDSKLTRTFVLTCQAGTLRAAAEQLGIEPSSVSRQLSALEREMGTTLLERSRRGVRPTEAGARLLGFLRQQQSDLEALQADFDALQSMRRGEVVIAIGDGFISDFISNALPSFRRALPGISYQLHSGSTEQVMKMVHDDQAHFGFAFNPRPDAALRVLHKARQPLSMLLAPDFDPQPRDGAISIQQLTRLPMALPLPDFGIGQLLRQTEAEYGLRFQAAVETNSLAALRNFVREGLGVTLLPAFVVAHEMASGAIRTRALDIPELTRGEAAVLTRFGRRLPEAAHRLATHSAQAMLAFRH